MPAIVQRYLFRETARSALFSLAVLMGVLVALFLAELLGEAARGDVAVGTVGWLLVLRLPEAAALVGPLALLTGILLALGQLGQGQELTVLRASGLDAGRVMGVLLLLAAAWSVALLVVTGWVGPWAAERSEQVLEQAGEESLLAGIREGQFERMERGALSIYVGRRGAEPATVEQVFIHHRGAEGPEIITARSGRVWLDPESGLRFLSLFDGYQVRHGEGASLFPLQQIRFERNDLMLPLGRTEARLPPVSRLSLPELVAESGVQAHRELHWRLAPAAAALLLALLAAPMALRNPRAGRFAGVVIALGIYLVYSNAVHLGLAWMERREIDSGPGLWPLHLMVLAVCVVFWIAVRRRW